MSGLPVLNEAQSSEKPESQEGGMKRRKVMVLVAVCGAGLLGQHLVDRVGQGPDRRLLAARQWQLELCRRVPDWVGEPVPWTGQQGRCDDTPGWLYEVAVSELSNACGIQELAEHGGNTWLGMFPRWGEFWARWRHALARPDRTWPEGTSGTFVSFGDPDAPCRDDDPAYHYWHELEMAP